MIRTVGLFFLSLLQVFGWILMILFAVFAVLLLTALFVPVRYQVQVQNKKTADVTAVSFLDQLRARVKVSWLLHFIYLTVDYQGAQGVVTRIRLAGMDLGKVRGWFSRKKGVLGSSQDAVEKAVNTTEAAEEKQPSEEKQLSEEKQTALQSKDFSVHHTSDLEHTDTDNKKTAHRQKKIPRKKKRRLQHTSGRAAGKKTLSGRAKTMEKLRRFKQEFTDETNRSAVSRLWIELCRILRSYMPAKLEADLTFSMADPALTGQVLGLVSMMPQVYRYPCAIAADFASDRWYIEGEVLLKGKVTLIVFLVSTVRLLLHKEFMKVVRRLTGRGKKQPSG